MMTDRFRVEQSDDPTHPIAAWLSNHGWVSMTRAEARALYEAIQDALGETGTFRLTPEQTRHIRDMGREDHE